MQKLLFTLIWSSLSLLIPPTLNAQTDTSIFDRFGIQPILEKLSTQEQYRDTRPSYANRIDFIAELGIEGCGIIKSTGLYERMVLKNLPK